MNTSGLSHQQVMRYNRQIVLPQIDLDGQEQLHGAKVAIVGMGGLGNAAAMSLVASGIGHVTLIDNDIVDATNLPRQTLFTDAEVGQPKVAAASASLTKLNSDCRIHCLQTMLTHENATDLLAGQDVVLDCTDNKIARLCVNTACVTLALPLVSGAAIRFEGQVFVGHPTHAPCYGCLGDLFTATELSCTEAGIFSPVAGIIGTYQAMLAMQLLVGAGNIPYGRLLCFDALQHQWQDYSVPRSPSCKLCLTR